jgi:hypothetical protein
MLHTPAGFYAELTKLTLNRIGWTEDDYIFSCMDWCGQLSNQIHGVCVCVCVCLWVWVHAHVGVCVGVKREKERQRERERERVCVRAHVLACKRACVQACSSTPTKTQVLQTVLIPILALVCPTSRGCVSDQSGYVSDKSGLFAGT